MKKLLFLITFSVSFFITYAQEKTDTVFYVTTETLPNSTVLSSHTSKSPVSIRAVEARASVFNVILENETNWDASMKRSVIYASRLWEEQLQTCYPRIQLKMVFSNIGTLLCSTKVAYLPNKHSYFSDPFTTSALLKYWQLNSPQYLRDMGSSDDELSIIRDVTDITIILNNQMISKYYCGTDGNTPSDKYDLVTLVIQEIAKGVGLNCRLIESLPFSKLPQQIIESNNDDDCAGLFLGYSNHNIASSARIYLKEYLHWVTPKFSSSRSSCHPYITETNTKLIDYDETTIFSNGQFKNVPSLIENRNTTNSNIRSERSYYTQPEEGRNFDGPDNPTEWRVDLLRKDGKFITIKRSDNWFSDFSFNPRQDIRNSDDWARDSDGNIRGRVYWCNPTSAPSAHCRDGLYYYTTIFIDHLPEIPELTGVSETKLASTPSNPNLITTHTLSFNAIGATSIEIKHQSNNGTQYYNIESDTDKFVIEDTDQNSEHYYTITAKNKNGQKTGNTIKFDDGSVIPEDQMIISSSDGKLHISINNIIVSYTITNINNPAYSISGHGTQSTIEVSIESLIPGIYAVSVVDNKGNNYAMKIVKR